MIWIRCCVLGLLVLFLTKKTGGKKHFVIAVENWEPYINAKEVDGTLDIRGPMNHLIRILADKLDFSYTLRHSPERVWGAPNKNGEWSGMLGMLIRKDAEMALGPFLVSHPREQVCDFSVPLTIDAVGIIVQRPKLETDFTNFLKPFHHWVYVAIAGSMFLITLFYKVVVSTEAALFGTRGITLSNSVLFAVRTLFQEASESLPRTNGSRILIGVWLLSSFIFMKSFEGTLTSMLTVPKVDIPIDSLQDLVNQDQFSWKLEKDTTMHQYFKEAKGGIAKEVHDKMNGTFAQCWLSRRNIRDGEFASVCEIISIQKMMDWDFSEHGECGLYAARQIVLGGFLISMAFTSNSTMKAPADQLLMRIVEGGLFAKWVQDEMVNATQCMAPPSSDKRGSLVLSLDAFYGAISCLGVGYLLAFAAFVVEWAAHLTRTNSGTNF